MQIGIDQTGKGEAIGPLYVVGVKAPLSLAIPLFRDSKSASSSEIDRALRFIDVNELQVYIKTITPLEIDSENINTLVQRSVVSIIRQSDATIAYVDSHYNRPQDYKNRLQSVVNSNIVTSNRLDQKNGLVALASLVAKKKRQEFLNLNNKSLIGSGNMNDPVTLKFMRTNPSSPLIRRKWLRNLKSF